MHFCLERQIYNADGRQIFTYILIFAFIFKHLCSMVLHFYFDDLSPPKNNFKDSLQFNATLPISVNKKQQSLMSFIT